MGARSGFSLVEVVIAAGVFALGVGAILGLLPGLLREQQAAEGMLTALRMADGIQSELRTIAGGDVAALRSQLAGARSETSSALKLVANRDGSGLRAWSSGDEGEQYFLVELYSFPGDSVAGRLATAVAVQAKVSWPFRGGVGESRIETPAAQRERVELNLVVDP